MTMKKILVLLSFSFMIPNIAPASTSNNNILSNMIDAFTKAFKEDKDNKNTKPDNKQTDKSGDTESKSKNTDEESSGSENSSTEKNQQQVSERPHIEINFEKGDKVFLKVFSWKGVMRFGKKGKLSF